MNNLLNCPVCGYKEISDNICPNCDTDLSLIRSLTELPPSSPSVGVGLTNVSVDKDISSNPPLRLPKWQVGVALLILIVGMCLGAIGSFLFLQPQMIGNTLNSPSPVAIKKDKTALPIAQAPANSQQPTQYTVKPKDTLTVITEMFCGKEKSWQVMVKANPELKGRENWIDVGEVLKLPNCEG